MNDTNAPANARATLSPAYGSLYALATKDRVPVVALIPANELRRLVATMID